MTFHSTNPSMQHYHNIVNTNLTSTMTPQSLSFSHLSSTGRSFMAEIHVLEILLAFLVFVTINSLRQRKHQGLPVWPLVGMLPSLIFGLRTNFYEWMADILSQQNGTFTFKSLWFTNINSVITSDPRNLEYLLKTKFSNYPKGGYFRDTMKDFLGNGIFNADDETWQKQRKTASIEFHSSKFRKMTTESLFDLVHARLLPVLKEVCEKSQEIDLQDILLRLTFDNVCMIAFGVDPGCLRLGLPNIPFAKAFEDATEAALLRFVTPTFIWKTMRFLDLGFEKNLKTSIKDVDEFADDVIHTRKKELMSKVGDENQRSDLLTIFMGIKDENGNAFSDKFLRDICVNFILAGRDTSSVALSWFFWLLNHNTGVEERILEEICGIIEERNDGGREDGNNDLVFRPEEVKKMEYLHAALSESLRLYPSVPMDHKEAVEDDVFPDGRVLKKGTKIVYAIYAMGRMEAIWGKDCREYRPERWLRDGRFMSESAYKFTAFNGGPRLCLGKDFAYYQMKYVAASILYRYKVTVVKNHPVEPKLALTMYINDGLKVNLCKRDGCELQKFYKQ